jgi:hypothetical protein
MMSEELNKSQISDGYHTFDELYEHRNLLFINLCLLRPLASWVKKEEDFPGYFCLYSVFPQGQISYHIPNKYRHMVEHLNKIHNRADTEAWDGHSSQDVINRLIKRGEDIW